MYTCVCVCVSVYLCSGDVLQLEELLHQDLIDLHQDHVHPISVDQCQVSVTLLHTHAHRDVKVMSQ